MARRQRDELFAPDIEKRIAADEERADAHLHQGCERRVDLARGAGVGGHGVAADGAAAVCNSSSGARLILDCRD